MGSKRWKLLKRQIPKVAISCLRWSEDFHPGGQMRKLGVKARPTRMSFSKQVGWDNTLSHPAASLQGRLREGLQGNKNERKQNKNPTRGVCKHSCPGPNRCSSELQLQGIPSSQDLEDSGGQQASSHCIYQLRREVLPNVMK